MSTTPIDLTKPLVNKKIQSALNEALSEDETVLGQLGISNEAVIATNRRVLIIKVGPITGNIFGGSKVNSWLYRNIQSVEVGTSMMACRLEIKHAGMVRQAGGITDQAKADNVVLYTKTDLPSVKALARLIEEQMAEATAPAPVPASIPTPSPTSTAVTEDSLDRLKKLADLKQMGALSEEEFAVAKTAILKQIAG